MIPATLLLHTTLKRLREHRDEAVTLLRTMRDEGASPSAIAIQGTRIYTFNDALEVVASADDEVSRMTTAEQVEAMERIALEEV